MALRPADFDYVVALVRREAAIVLEPGKEFLAEQRLARLIRDLNYPSTDALCDAMRKTPIGDLHRRVVDAMTTNETMWFRDQAPFDAMRTSVIPDLLARRSPSHTFVVWSAACSTGQEPYSLAMMLRDAFPQHASRFQIIATDLSRECVTKAKTATYSQFEINRGLPAVALIKHFAQRGSEWEIKPEIRRMVTFHELNLTGSWSVVPQQVDVVFIRNVLIYFDVPTKQQIFGNLRRVLRADGYMFVGSGESLAGVDDRYERTPIGRATAYRPGPVRPITASSSSSSPSSASTSSYSPGVKLHA
jgi:chemotaxis protein methyltransferase CheR